MDLDVFVTAHRAEWDRLEELLRRKRRLTGAEADELVALYQRTTTHLSLLQTSAPDPHPGRLTSLVARARSTVTGARKASWRDVARFFTVSFPAAVYRLRHWWIRRPSCPPRPAPSSPGGSPPTPRSRPRSAPPKTSAP
ncbi:hypothetical protein SRIMM317S_03977 [Streptomyces rimosus subsp. rimosus]